MPTSILKNDKPRSISPNVPSSSSGQSDRSQTPHRFRTPNRSQGHHFNATTNPTFQPHQYNHGSNYRNTHYSNNGFPPRAQPNSGYQRPVTPRFSQNPQGQRPTGVTNHRPRPTVSVSKSPEKRDGYWKEVTFVDEKGITKSVMAWVPHDI